MSEPPTNPRHIEADPEWVDKARSRFDVKGVCARVEKPVSPIEAENECRALTERIKKAEDGYLAARNSGNTKKLKSCYTEIVVLNSVLYLIANELFQIPHLYWGFKEDADTKNVGSENSSAKSEDSCNTDKKADKKPKVYPSQRPSKQYNLEGRSFPGPQHTSGIPEQPGSIDTTPALSDCIDLGDIEARNYLWWKYYRDWFPQPPDRFKDWWEPFPEQGFIGRGSPLWLWDKS